MRTFLFFQKFPRGANAFVKWLVLALPLALGVGSLVALFLYLLDLVTTLRWGHAWLIALLPLAGLGIHWLYKLWGKNSERGNNLILDEIHRPGGGVPARMSPLVLLSTLITHLFGGSAGREGTAVQMGGSTAAFMNRLLRLPEEDRRLLLTMGMAAGFGAVFGTPLAGAVFAIEVLTVGRLKYSALIPCLIVAFLADAICLGWGIHHTPYSIAPSLSSPAFLHFDVRLLLKAGLAATAFGGLSYCFAKTTHLIQRTTNHWFPQRSWLVPFLGGCLLLGIFCIPGTEAYQGLGVNARTAEGVSIVTAFHEGGAQPFSWLWKLLLTALTLGTGFKGGEVTPLFFMGATLGNVLASWLGAPVDLMAGLGLIAVFAGATKTPIACTLMGLELFGPEYGLYFLVSCYVAFYCSGKVGIYSAQRRGVEEA